MTSQLNNSSEIILNGSFEKNTLTFSGDIRNKNAILTLKNAALDFKNRLYKISAEIKENKTIGKLEILISPSKIDLLVENFSIRGVGKVLDKILPK